MNIGNTLSILKQGRKYTKNFWILILILYNSTVLISFFRETRFSTLMTLPFYIFIPGYSFSELFFKFDSILEKFVASLGISISLYVGLRAFTIALFRIYDTPLNLILAIMSEIILTVELVITLVIILKK